MANLNKVFLIGNLTRDVRMSYTPNNTAVANLGMAINRTWMGQDGQKNEETTFVDLAMFGRRAEVLGKFLSKGDPLFVEGRLKLESWDDKQSGQRRNKLSVVIEDFQFLGRGAGGGGGGGGSPEGGRGRSSGGGRSAPPQAPQPEDYSQDPMPEDDDIPF